MTKIIAIIFVALLSAMGSAVAQTTQPFGVPLQTAPDEDAGLWRYTLRSIELDRIAILKCRASHECSPQTKRFVDILDEADSQVGKARLGHLNRGMNLAFKATEHCAASRGWTDPTETLWEGCGDCKEHAILKAVVLLIMGYDARIVIGHKRLSPAKENHAVVAVKFEGAWLVLDNSIVNGVILPDVEKRGFFTAYYSLKLPEVKVRAEN